MDYERLKAEVLLPAYSKEADAKIAAMLNVPQAVDLGYRALTDAVKRALKEDRLERVSGGQA